MQAVVLSLLACVAAAAPSLVANTTTVSHHTPLGVQGSGLPNNAKVWLGVFYPANASLVPITPLPYPATAPWTTNAVS